MTTIAGATTPALKRLFENNSTNNKDIKPFSDLKSTHFILPPVRFSHSSSFYHRSWCENRPFLPPCFATWPNHTKIRKTTPKRKLALPPSNLIDFLRDFGCRLRTTLSTCCPNLARSDRTVDEIIVNRLSQISPLPTCAFFSLFTY